LGPMKLFAGLLSTFDLWDAGVSKCRFAISAILFELGSYYDLAICENEYIFRGVCCNGDLWSPADFREQLFR
jgi:hypothetical protein